MLPASGLQLRLSGGAGREGAAHGLERIGGFGAGGAADILCRESRAAPKRCPPDAPDSGHSMTPGRRLRRRVAAIARACGIAGHPLDTKHPAIRETLRGIGRKHGSPARRAAALTTAEIRKLCRACGAGLAGARDRALFLLGFAGALRRSELVGLDVAHVT